MRMVLRLNKDAADKLMKSCGQDGVLIGNYIETQADLKMFATIPLDLSREKALERASFHGAGCWGVVPQRNGLWGPFFVLIRFGCIVNSWASFDFREL